MGKRGKLRRPSHLPSDSCRVIPPRPRDHTTSNGDEAEILSSLSYYLHSSADRGCLWVEFLRVAGPQSISLHDNMQKVSARRSHEVAC